MFGISDSTVEVVERDGLFEFGVNVEKGRYLFGVEEYETLYHWVNEICMIRNRKHGVVW